VCFSAVALTRGEVVSLFDRNSLANWEIQSGGRFSAKNGVLKVYKGAGWLRFVDTFADYTLTIEFRFLEEGSNSGIFVRTGPRLAKMMKAVGRTTGTKCSAWTR